MKRVCALLIPLLRHDGGADRKMDNSSTWRTTMKMLFAVLACAFPLLAQAPAPASSACGNLHVNMAVDLDDSSHLIQGPAEGKARIYFIQDTGLTTNLGYPTTRIGIDGMWVGANKKNSYFSVGVAPGEHHLCLAVQSVITHWAPEVIEFAHLNAEAGQVYYYRSRIISSRSGPEYLVFDPVDSDEAKYLIAAYPLSVAHPKK